MQRTWRHVKLERKKIVSMKAKRKKMGYISIYFTAGRSSMHVSWLSEWTPALRERPLR